MATTLASAFLWSALFGRSRVSTCAPTKYTRGVSCCTALTVCRNRFSTLKVKKKKKKISGDVGCTCELENRAARPPAWKPSPPALCPSTRRASFRLRVSCAVQECQPVPPAVELQRATLLQSCDTVSELTKLLRRHGATSGGKPCTFYV